MLDASVSGSTCCSTPAEDASPTLYDPREYGKALREIMALADLANQYVDPNKPWELAKALRPERASCTQVCSTRSTLFRMLTFYLKPVLPRLASDVEAFLQFRAA